MIDYYLKFASKQEAETVLTDIKASIDIIGTIYKPSGNVIIGNDNIEYPEILPLEGYHVNIRSNEHIAILEPYVINPKTPSRVWA